MAKQEQFRNEQQGEKPPQPETKKNPDGSDNYYVESSPIDSRFPVNMINYYDKRNGYTIAPDIGVNISREHENKFVEESKKSLRKLADPEYAHSLYAEDEVSFGLSEIAGVMAIYTPEYIESEKTEEDKQMGEKSYTDAKKLFMDSCRKLFPQPEEATNINIGQFQSEVEKLKKCDLFPKFSRTEPKIKMSDVLRLARENPKEMRKQLDEILSNAGKVAAKDALYFSEEESDVRQSNQNRLGSSLEPTYRLLVIRDQLTEKIYGRKDITPTEERQIDEAREKVK